MLKTIAPGCIGHQPPLREAVSVLHACGAKGIWLDLSAEIAADPQKARALIDEAGLIPAGFNSAIPWTVSDPMDVSCLEEQAVLAEKLGITRASGGFVPFSDDMNFAENYVFHLKRFREAVKIFSSHGIRLGVEFVGVPSLRKGHRYDFIHEMNGMLEFLSEVDGQQNTGLLLDLFHFETAGHKNSELLSLKPEQIVLVHVMDAPDVPMNEQQDQVRALPGATGVLHIHEFLNNLVAIDCDAPVFPEPFDPSLAKLSFSEAAGKTMAALNSVWPEQR